MASRKLGGPWGHLARMIEKGANTERQLVLQSRESEMLLTSDRLSRMIRVGLVHLDEDGVLSLTDKAREQMQ